MARTQLDTKHYRSLGAVTFVERHERGVLLGVGEEKFRVDVIRADLVRLKLSRGRVFDEQPTFAACFDEPASAEFELCEHDDRLELTTTALRLVVYKQAFGVDAYRSDGSTIFEDARDSRGFPVGLLTLNDSFVVSRRIGAHDSVYGLGEKTGSFDRRGRDFILWNLDIMTPNALGVNGLHGEHLEQDAASTLYDPYYASIPFFYLCRATANRADLAGFFVDNGYKAEFEFSQRDVYRYAFHGGQYTEYVFAGPDMPGILEAYTHVTGRMAAPPLWALGNHQCRFHDYDAAGILNVGRQYRARGIPCDVLWLDIGHMNGYRVFTWDAQKFPDPAAVSGAMTDMAFRLVTIVDPGVKAEPGYAVYDSGVERNAFCKTEGGGHYIGHVWPGLTVFPDFTRAETRAWWGALNARHLESGVAGIWNDMNEPATGEVEPFSMRFDRDGANHPHERFHNQYGLLMAMSTHQGLLEARPDARPFILTRAGFAGIQRYAAQWLGDNQSSWPHLELSVSMALGMGISGQPFVGADIPGFFARPTPELATRWVQYGALSPFCRFHNNNNERDQYPWSFGTGVEKRCKDALEQRYRLLPYLYTTFMRASESGAPVQRPLVYDFQHDRQARETEDAYLLGEALLVAPILEPGQSARHVYLPRGSWIDFHSGERHLGEQSITAKAPLDRIPLFGRGGHVVPALERAPQSTMALGADVLELHLFVPAEDGVFESFLHEDDGVTHAFQRGALLCTSFRVERGQGRLSLSASASGGGFSELQRKRLRVVFHGQTPARVSLDGRPHTLEGNAFDFANDGQSFQIEAELGEQ
ncbi:MAG TPA: glycoside hydrolase family 31 protein [Polyangiaceae bacterium]|nr:glycoside hydrolase family 31 protein [Polyangiaceae bacterium]